MENVGQRIKARRKELGLSAEQVANIMGVSPATVYRYESRYILNMGADKLEGIAKALRTTPKYLMGWDEKEPEDLATLAASILQDAELLAMIEQYRTLDRADQRAVQAMVGALAAKKG